MAKRKHRNKLSRVTARERAIALIAVHFPFDNGEVERAIEGAIQAHARATLDRAKRRAR